MFPHLPRSSRSPRFTARAATAPALAVALLLTACGSGGGGSGTAQPAAAPPQAGATAGAAFSPSERTAEVLKGVTTDETLAAEVPADIRKAGAIVVGSPMRAAPSNFYAADGKTPAGYEVDLARAIGQKLGLSVTHEAMAFNSLISSLSTGRIDMVMAAMNDTKERQATVDFVDYLTSGIVMTVQKGNPEGIKQPDDLCGKTVAVGLGTSQEVYAQELSAKCQAAGRPPVEIAVDSEHSQRINSLRTGRADALIMDLGGAIYTAKTAGNGEFFEVVDYPLINGAPYGIAFNKQDGELRSAVQKALQSLMDDGTYDEILRAWGVERGAVDQAVVNGA